MIRGTQAAGVRLGKRLRSLDRLGRAVMGVRRSEEVGKQRNAKGLDGGG